MMNDHRELTGKEKRQIKKLVTSLCANYDSEYGCLPLDSDCYMFGICYRSSALCKYFRNTALPTEPELEAVFAPQPMTACRECGKKFPVNGKLVYCSEACSEAQGENRQRQEYENTGSNTRRNETM